MTHRSLYAVSFISVCYGLYLLLAGLNDLSDPSGDPTVHRTSDFTFWFAYVLIGFIALRTALSLDRLAARGHRISHTDQPSDER